MLDRETLRKQRDFVSVYSRGESTGSKYIVILYKNNRFDYSRTSFVASKKVGNSVARNRARRLMRESYRAINCENNLENNLKKGIDIIFVARNTIKPEVKMDDVKKSMIKGLNNLGLIK